VFILRTYLNQYKGKVVLVTGGAGFIGSNLVTALIKTQAKKIIVLDDLTSSYKWNVPDDPCVFFIHGSILEEEKLKTTFSEKPDYVFHLAAHFANQNSIEHPETNLMVNGLGPLRLLQYSNLTNVKRFVYASSGCSVYGSSAPLPLKEDFVSLHLDTPYQINKLIGELYCNFFYDHYRLPITIARYFNVYGPGEVPGRYRNVIPNFIYWALHRKPLPITGTGKETRDFTFIDDIVDATLGAGVIKEALGEAINFASGTETRIIDLANMINDLTNNDKGITFVGRRRWDKARRRRASIEKAKKILGYNPKTNIKTGIQKAISWFTENLENINKSARF